MTREQLCTAASASSQAHVNGPFFSMRVSVALSRSASAASLEFLAWEFLAGPSGMRTKKTMYKMPTTMAPANVVKNAVVILAFMAAPQQRCHYATLRQFCALLQARS
jgi:hypothetical protein